MNSSSYSTAEGPSHPRDSPGAASYDLSEPTLPGEQGEFSLEKTMRETLKRLEGSGITPRTLGVYFKDLRVTGTGASSFFQNTVGSRLNPKVAYDDIRRALRPETRDILCGFNGVLRPGEMLLVLGSPGSGCTTFLKMLANQRETYHDVQGEVYYDSLTPEEMKAHYRGDLQFIPEDDIHFATLTVEETLRFAAKTRTPQVRIAGTSRENHVDYITNTLMTVLGLDHCRKTRIGNAAIRGLSGGEKKRVSIAEALACRSLIDCWDNSTRGLDSSTALEFATALRTVTDIRGVATAFTAYQASESVSKLFHKVCLIYEGRMAYFGPSNLARQYFIDLGFEPVNRQTTPDFLVAVTDPDARNIRRGFENQAPRTADDFAKRFLESDIAAINEQDMDSYRRDFIGRGDLAKSYSRQVKDEHAKTARKGSPYIVSIPMQTRAVIVRRFQILKGSIVPQAAQILSFLITSVIIGTVFVRLQDSTSAFFSRGGILFLAVLFTTLVPLAEIPTLYGQRPIVLRHKKAAMYHPFVEAFAMTLADIPITLVTLTIYCIVLYFVVGLQASAGQFSVFYLFIVSISLVMKAYFRTVASIFSEPAPAQAIAGVTLLVLTLYTGYQIPVPEMIGALRWLIYINPVRYAYESILTNEFRTLQGTCSTLVPSGAGYEGTSIQNQACPVVGAIPGQSHVDGNRYVSLSFEYTYSHTWRNFGILVAFGVFFLITYFIITEINSGAAEFRSVVEFKRGARNVQKVASSPRDVENGSGSGSGGDAVTPVQAEKKNEQRTKEVENSLEESLKTTDIMSWAHLTYRVSVGGEKRHLLNDITGWVVPGKLTALMGESGAGKTTLLNVLAHRADVGVITGDQFVNGQALPADFQAQTGYCQQMDTHEPRSTVREAVLFSAVLRQPQSVPMEEKQAYVDKCLVMCGLQGFKDVIVSSLGVEQKKRLTIAVELAAKPKLLLFLDEPTSGLDSQSAWAIIAFLRALAEVGQAILCTVHQPSAELFQSFDRILLLQRGGETVYFGDLGHNATTLIKYFERNGSRPCGPEENPAEFMLDVIGAGATATSDRDWHNDVWKKSPEAKAVLEELEHIHAGGRSRPPVKEALHSEYSTPWLHQVRILIVRNARSLWRDPTYIFAKFFLNVTSGLFIGFTFWKSPSTLQGTQDKLFSVFTALIVSVPAAQQLQVPFITMRSIYEIRERPSKMYSWSAWVTSQLVMELPWNIFCATVYFFCWYWTVGYSTSRAGYTYLMLSVLLPAYYTTIGQAIAAMSPSPEVAALIFTSAFNFVLLFNGVLQPFMELGWWQWMYRASPYTYLIEGLLGNALGGQEVDCSSMEYTYIDPPSGQTCLQYLGMYISANGGYVSNPSATSQCQFCRYRTADEYLNANFNIRYSHRWRNAGLFIVFIVFNTFCIYAFTYLFRMKQWEIPAVLKRMTSDGPQESGSPSGEERHLSTV
ncbi:pleiotropic drug resistance ABC transporter [Thelephora ganbajun]|uniref:Pleiotropic drug resistance ABC transporter n=1 Tax=Thelephora ganbajun TaxID=370292 RepID=A0ACB6ZMV7_THEGA|nr:pleiotropic drug resistance ABC transporter [Thelephora ganbajun]